MSLFITSFTVMQSCPVMSLVILKVMLKVMSGYIKSNSVDELMIVQYIIQLS